jgi:putative membrane protein
MVMTSWFGMGVVWIWPLLVLVGIGAVVWGLSRGTSGGAAPAQGGPDPAHQVLRERFARGEITETEYRDRMRVLDGH